MPPSRGSAASVEETDDSDQDGDASEDDEATPAGMRERRDSTVSSDSSDDSDQEGGRLDALDIEFDGAVITEAEMTPIQEVRSMQLYTSQLRTLWLIIMIYAVRLSLEQ